MSVLSESPPKIVGSGMDALHEIRHQASQAASLLAYCGERMADGGVFQAARVLMDVQFDALAAWAGVLKGEREGLDVLSELGSRTRAGLRYEPLVQTWGRQLFGSAKLAGEQVLGEDAHYRLVFVPAKVGAEPQPALFHVGGVLPYGDPLFRLLPEACFFERFTERGMPVYALELKGDRDQVSFQDLTLEKVVDAVAHFSGLAFDHAQGKKLVLEGYCGLASQALAYVMARPLEANARFRVVSTFVGPVDGTRCEGLAEIMAVLPDAVLEATYRMADFTKDYISGDNLRTTQDLALKGFLGKTPLGRFAAGWKHPEYAALDGLANLTPEMRKDLAGAYWISPENCRRWPVPTNLGRFFAGQFTKGVTPQGVFPATYRGRPLSLADAAQGTSLQFVGFYGGKDQLVPETTAQVMEQVFGPRYTHVVHPAAGHVSYVFSPRVWERANPKGLEPNPVDVLLERYRLD